MGWCEKRLLMRTIVQFIVGFTIGRVVTLTVLIVIGLAIVGAHGQTNTPAPEVQVREQQRHDVAEGLAYEEEQREAEYAATPGPPYPVKTFTP